MSPCCLLLKLTAAVFFILTTRWMCFLLELTQLNSAKGFMVSFPNLLKILRPHKHYTSYISIHISVVYIHQREKNRQSVSISSWGLIKWLMLYWNQNIPSNKNKTLNLGTFYSRLKTTHHYMVHFHNCVESSCHWFESGKIEFG